MKNFLQTTFILSVLVFVAACSSKSVESPNADLTKEEQKTLEKKKSKLTKLKSEMAELKSEINALEAEIAEIDPESDANEILVTTLQLNRKPFRHYLELRGSVESRKNVMLSAETMGRVEKVYVTEGQKVSKGQVLVLLDDDIIQNNIDEVTTQLELAEAVYKRQKRLWDQKIGTEIQYLEAKNSYNSLKARKETLNAQLKQTRIKAPFGGTVDKVDVKVGEMLQPGIPTIRIVSPRDMYIQADVSEAYIGAFSAGDEVEVTFPGAEKTFKSKVKAVSNVLKPDNRTFQMEIELPKTNSFEYRPNQLAVIKIADYEQEEAVVIPTNVIQAGRDGKFVYTLTNKENEQVAAKTMIEVGKSQAGETEVVSGLKGDEIIIDKGFREVSDGVIVKVTEG